MGEASTIAAVIGLAVTATTPPCNTVLGPCDAVNAYSTLAVGVIAVPALLVSSILAWKAWQATRAAVTQATAQYALLTVVVTSAAAHQTDRLGTVANVSGVMPAQKIVLWVRDNAFYGPWETDLIKVGESKAFSVGTGRQPGCLSRFRRLPKNRPSWAITWRNPDESSRFNRS